MKYILTILVSLMLCPLMRAGEKPSTIPLQDDFPGNRNLSYRKAAPITFTGNPSVDFFGLDNRLAFREPFAKMFDTLVTEEYSGEKNKWLATGLSLVLPGAGEFYTKSYVKSGIFLAVELTAFILQSRYNTRGDEQTAYFEKYSDQHYSADQYARWTVNNTSALNPALNANNYHVFVQGAPGGPPYEDINWSELNRLERDVANRTDGQFNGYTHAMPYYSEQQYFELIGKYDQFSTGWDDADTSSYLPGSGAVINRSLRQQRYYMDQRADANHYYDLAGTYVGIIVANHLLSALDAYWSATRFNNSLHAEFNMKLRPTTTGLVAVPEADFRFDF